MLIRGKNAFQSTRVDVGGRKEIGDLDRSRFRLEIHRIELDVADAKGAVTHWSIELGSTSILMRAGWKFNTLKKGDKVSALVSPLRTGEPGSLLNRLTLADGRVLLNGPGGAVATPAAPAAQR